MMEVERILGIDLGRRFGWAVLDSQGRHLAGGSIRLEKEHMGQRLVELANHIHRIGMAYKVDAVVVEEPPYVQNAATHRDLSAYWGVVLVEAEDRLVPYTDVAVGTLKKFATGDGRASKKDMRHAFEEHFGSVPDDDNHADAAFCALYGAAEVWPDV